MGLQFHTFSHHKDNAGIYSIQKIFPKDL